MIKSTKKSQIERKWHFIDAKDQVLGRLATRITPMLMGKCKPYFVKNLDCGDHVVVINAKEVAVTGRKESQKVYQSYSGYPGGLKKTPLARLRDKAPEKIIEKAVYNMLPKNKLRSEWMTRLHVFTEEKHPYEDKLKKESQ